MSEDIFKLPKGDDDLTDIDGKKKKGKSKADKSIEGTMDIFGDLKKQGKGKSGLDDDIFGFKAEAKGKKKGKKGDSLDIGNIYGDLG